MGVRPTAADYGGVMWHFDRVPVAKPSRLQNVAAGLLRPTSLDNLEVRGLQLKVLPSGLPEGGSFREMVIGASIPERVTVTGRLWQRPVEWTLEGDPPTPRPVEAWLIEQTWNVELPHGYDSRPHDRYRVRLPLHAPQAPRARSRRPEKRSLIRYRDLPHFHDFEERGLVLQ